VIFEVFFTSNLTVVSFNAIKSDISVNLSIVANNMNIQSNIMCSEKYNQINCAMEILLHSSSLDHIRFHNYWIILR